MIVIQCKFVMMMMIKQIAIVRHPSEEQNEKLDHMTCLPT